MIYRAVCEHCDVTIPSDRTHMIINFRESSGACFKSFVWCDKCTKSITAFEARFFTALLNGDVYRMEFEWKEGL